MADPAAMEQAVLAAMPRYRWTADEAAAQAPKLTGKNIIVTGATSGIGIPTAIALARTGANVTFTARDEARGASTLKAVQEAVPEANVRCAALDLASLASVQRFVAEWGEQPVDVLLHNAGVMATPFTVTTDGIELQLQVNYVAVVLLTELLRPLLTSHARVIIVSSVAHKLLAAVDDVPQKIAAMLKGAAEATYDKWMAYAFAKTASIMYANALNAEIEASGSGVRVNSLHPGAILTGLQSSLTQEEMRGLGWLDEKGNAIPIFKNAEQGASTSVWACTSPELEGVGGKYLENCEVTPAESASDAKSDASADVMTRVKGTAPHVWRADDCAKVAAIARAALEERKYLPTS